MKSLKQIANELFDYAYPLKQTDRGAYDLITDLAGELHRYHSDLEEIVKGKDDGTLAN